MSARLGYDVLPHDLHRPYNHGMSNMHQDFRVPPGITVATARETLRMTQCSIRSEDRFLTQVQASTPSTRAQKSTNSVVEQRLTPSDEKVVGEDSDAGSDSDDPDSVAKLTMFADWRGNEFVMWSRKRGRSCNSNEYPAVLSLRRCVFCKNHVHGKPFSNIMHDMRHRLYPQCGGFRRSHLSEMYEDKTQGGKQCPDHSFSRSQGGALNVACQD
eukprot:2737252-Amphidinium_carterae.1